MLIDDIEPIRRDVPHEPGQWIAIRPLSWKQLRTARKERSREVKKELNDLGAHVLAAYAKGGDQERAAKKIIRDMKYDEDQFDTQVLLSFGIVEWGYEKELNEDSIGKLDERTAAWAKDEILDLTRPPSEVEEKNSTGASTDI